MAESSPNAPKLHINKLLRPNTPAPPRFVAPGDWTIEKLQEHLQWAVDIEFYTIPYYMAAMYSIKDQASEAIRLLRSVAHQEMFHMQCAANLANAFGTKLQIVAPEYGGKIPHLDFALGKVDPTEYFSPYSTNIGVLDVERLNTMCIIEFPDWADEEDAKRLSAPRQPGEPEPEYSSIGAFYDNLEKGVEALASKIRADHQQVDYFARFYPDLDCFTITRSGLEGLPQARTLINAIVSQGEGRGSARDFVPDRFQNKADDIQPTWDHFEKFTYLRKQPLPETYTIGFGNPEGLQVQELLLRHFGEFLVQMNQLFGGKEISDFGPLMYKIGAAITACWQHGVTPEFAVNTGEIANM